MKLVNLFLSIVLLSFATAGAFAADADMAKKQAEVRKATTASLERFYKAKPELKAEVNKAPGYAVFTTYGLSLLVGVNAGRGLAHDNVTKKVTYMDMAQTSAGLQVGLAQSETLIVFKTKQAFTTFVEKGWEFGGGTAMQAGANEKSAGQAKGENVVADAQTYTLTKNGIQAGAALQGTKFAKTEGLN